MYIPKPVNFRQLAELLSPTWLRGYWGIRLVGCAIGLYHDLLAEGSGQAIKAHQLRSDTSPDDALPEVGRDRMMPRYPSDTADTYRERLIGAWDAYQFGGNEDSIEGQLNAFGLTSVDFRTVLDGWSFEWPSDTANCSRFVVIINAPHPWTGVSPTYGSGGTYGGGWLYGSDVTVAERSTIFGIIDKWKSGHEICPLVIIHLSGIYYGMPGLVYGGGSVYGAASTIRLLHP